MSRFLGQILRMLGLLVEMLGILVLALKTGTDEDGAPLPGSFSPRLVWGVIAVGFVVWLAGTILTYWPAAKVEKAAPARPGEEGLRL